MIITLTTDFGIRDTFVAEMKGVILSINPSVTIVDITHEIEPYNILEAAIKLASATRYFPSHTIHIAVIDPGVGSPRRPIILKTERAFYVGPDNGVFSMVMKNEKVLSFYEITIKLPYSRTFHGRDLFAPVAARLSLGEDPEVMARPIEEIVEIKIPEPFKEPKRIVGHVIIIDRFGNAITNITDKDIGTDRFKVKVGEKSIEVFNYYKEAEGLEAGAIINSSGYLEIFKYRGSIMSDLGLKIGDRVEVHIE